MFGTRYSSSPDRFASLIAMQLFVGPIQWEECTAVWGPKKPICLKSQWPGNKTEPKEKFATGLRLSTQPFAIGGMRLAFYALTDVNRRHGLHSCALATLHAAPYAKG